MCNKQVVIQSSIHLLSLTLKGKEKLYTHRKKAINSKLTIAVHFWIKTDLLSGRFAKNIPSYAWYATHKKYCSGVVPNLAVLCFQTKVKLYITGNLENGKKNSVQKQMFVQVTYRTPWHTIDISLCLAPLVPWQPVSDQCSCGTRRYSVSTVLFRSSEEDECQPNPCQNGGRCMAHYFGGGFDCECPMGFRGTTCQGQLNFSLPNFNCING